MLRLGEEQGHDPQKKAMIYHWNKAEKKSKVIAERKIRHLFWQNSILTAIISHGTAPGASSKVATEMTFLSLPTLASALQLRIIFCYISWFCCDFFSCPTIQPQAYKEFNTSLTEHAFSFKPNEAMVYPHPNIFFIFCLTTYRSTPLITRDKSRRELKKKGAEIFHSRSPTFDSTDLGRGLSRANNRSVG